MKKLTISFLLFLSLFGCSQKDDSVYKEVEEVSVQINKSKEGISYSTVETTFEVLSVSIPKHEYQEYLAKFKAITTATQGVEGKERTIEVTLRPLKSPSEIAFSAKQECDEIELHNHFYKTIKYGCCTDLNTIKFFDYSNAEIIEGSDKIITAIIPNNKNIIYIAFSNSNQDDNTLGRITISYNSERRYNINLINSKLINRKPLNVLLCPVIYPEITLLSPYKKDTQYDNENNSYMLWSLEKIKSTSEINNISVRVNFSCDPSMKPIVIPIINGLPFGKDQKEQTYDVRKLKSQ